MAVVGLQFHVGHVAIARAQGAHQFLRLVAGVEPVRTEADHQEARLRLLQGGGQRSVAVGQVEIVHRLGDVEVRVGVEAVDELAAAIAQVALHFEIHVEAEAEVLLAAQAAAELLAHGIVAHVGDVADHARHGEAARRRLLVVVVAVVEIGVGHDGLAAHFVEGDLLRAVARGGGDGDGADHGLGIGGRPFQRLHAAHRSAGDGEQALDAEESISIFCSRTMSPMVITGNAMAYGQPVAGLIDDGSGGAAAAAQHVGADHEILVGVEGLAGADHVVPPAGLAGFGADAGGVGVAGEGVQHQDGVGLGGVQLAVGLVGHLHRRERGAVVQRDGVEPNSIGLNDHFVGVSS